MADDFKALLEEQKRTTRLLMSVEERAEEDTRIAAASQARSEAAREGWETRRAEREDEQSGADKEQTGWLQSLGDKFTKFSLFSRASGAADAEDEDKKESFFKKIGGFMGKTAGFMGGLAKKGAKEAAAKLPSMKSLLMTGGLAALLLFLKSPYFVMVKDFVEKHILPLLSALWENIKAMWGPLKKFFVETLWPMAKMLYEDYLKPIGAIWGDYIMGYWENIKLLFSDLSAVFSLFSEGKWKEGIVKFFNDIVPRLGKMIDNMATAIWNTIAKVFGKGETDSVFGSISNFFTNMYNDIIFWITQTWNSITSTISGVWTDVKDFFLKIFSWGKQDGEEDWSLMTHITTQWTKIKGWFTKLFSWAGQEDPKDSWVITTIKDIVTSVKEWLGKLFKFDSASKTLTSVFNILTFVPNIIKDGLLAATSWLLSLFGFDDAAKKVTGFNDWTIGGVITSALKGIVKWIGGLFDIDWKGLLTSIIPSWVPDKALGWLGIGDAADDPSGAAGRAKAAADRDILRGKASELESQIAAGDLKGAWFTTTSGDLKDAKKELDEMKAQIRALDAKASVTAVDAKQIADNRKTNNVVYNQTQLRNQTSAAWAAAGSAW